MTNMVKEELRADVLRDSRAASQLRFAGIRGLKERLGKEAPVPAASPALPSPVIPSPIKTEHGTSINTSMDTSMNTTLPYTTLAETTPNPPSNPRPNPPWKSSPNPWSYSTTWPSRRNSAVGDNTSFDRSSPYSRPAFAGRSALKFEPILMHRSANTSFDTAGPSSPHTPQRSPMAETLSKLVLPLVLVLTTVLFIYWTVNRVVNAHLEQLLASDTGKKDYKLWMKSFNWQILDELARVDKMQT